MRAAPLLLLVVVAAFAQSSLAEGPEASLTACGEPRIEWDFATTLQYSYSTQVWNGGEWQNVGHPSIEPRATQEIVLDPGTFYRVQGCSDGTCATSNVLWSPALACGPFDEAGEAAIAEQLPSGTFTLKMHDGTQLIITHGTEDNTPLKMRIGEHNALLAWQHIEDMYAAGVENMTPMKLRYIESHSDITLVDEINRGVFELYENTRTRQLVNYDGTGVWDGIEQWYPDSIPPDL